MLVFFILLLLLLPLRGGMDLPITPFLSIPILIYFEVMYLYLPRLEWKWKLLSCIQLFGTHGIFSPWNSPSQNTIMGTFPFSRGYSQPRDRTQVSRIAGGFFTTEPPGKPKNIGAGSLSLLQQIFPTEELNRGLLHYRQVLYQLTNQGSQV